MSHHRHPPQPDVAATRREIGRALRAVMRLSPEVHGALAQSLGVGVTDLLALDRLTATDDPMGVVELGNTLGIRSASATVLVDRLVSGGHLQRAPHPSDGRRRIVRPTDSAHRDVLAALGPLITGIGAVTDGLDAEASATVLRFLREVCAVLEQFAAGGPDGGPAGRRARDRPAP
jgi:DNA-binding MarR family transcriptional regulator